MALSKLVCGLKQACLLLAIALLYNSCVHIWPPAEMQNSTFTFTNLFANCHNPRSSSAGLPYKGSVLVTYLSQDGTKTRDNPLVTFSSGADPSIPVNVTVPVPKTARYYLDIIVSSTVCTTCTPQFGPDWSCPQIAVTGGISAGMVRYEVQSGIQTYVATRNISAGPNGWHVLPVPNSCGCVVP